MFNVVKQWLHKVRKRTESRTVLNEEVSDSEAGVAGAEGHGDVGRKDVGVAEA